MITYEITLTGFDASTDETDHLVLWVNANNWDELIQALRPISQHIDAIDTVSLGSLPTADGVDVILPEQTELLHAKVKGLMS